MLDEDAERGLTVATVLVTDVERDLTVVPGFSATDDATLHPDRLPEDGRRCFVAAGCGCISASVDGLAGKLSALCLVVPVVPAALRALALRVPMTLLPAVFISDARRRAMAHTALAHPRSLHTTNPIVIFTPHGRGPHKTQHNVERIRLGRAPPRGPLARSIPRK